MSKITLYFGLLSKKRKSWFPLQICFWVVPSFFLSAPICIPFFRSLLCQTFALAWLIMVSLIRAFEPFGKLPTHCSFVLLKLLIWFCFQRKDYSQNVSSKVRLPLVVHSWHKFESFKVFKVKTRRVLLLFYVCQIESIGWSRNIKAICNYHVLYRLSISMKENILFFPRQNFSMAFVSFFSTNHAR